MEGHLWWQWVSHNAYVLLTIIGVIAVLGYVIWERRKKRNKY